MNRFAVLAFLFGAVVGAMLVYFLMQRQADAVPVAWQDLAMDKAGPGFSTESFAADIPLPDLHDISGKAKFLDSDQAGRHLITLGYIVRVSVDHLKAADIPAKYKQPRKLGSLTLLPTTEVAYSVDLTFDLKDADGFVLSTLTSGPLDILSGKENDFQGIAKEPVELDVAQKTKTIQMVFSVEKCVTCQ